MRLLGLKTFRHGVHPPELKDETSHLAIRQFPFAPVLAVPLLQHMGKPAIPTVVEGQEVTRGQMIAGPDGFMSVAMHAPASGVVRRIGLMPGIAGRMIPGVFIEPYPGSTQEIADGDPCPVDATVDEIHVKLKIPEGKHVDTLIINGVECEPYLTTDHRVMLEQCEDVFTGVRYLMKVTGARRVIVGVEANKPDAAEVLRAAAPTDLDLSVELLHVKYPQGAEKMLITALLGREVPSGALPVDVHALCCNVATTAEIGRLLPHGRGIQERVITITGPAVRNKGNYRIPIGTPLRYLLEHVGVEPEFTRVFLGGPMMGQAASSLDLVITKGTSGVVAFTETEAERTHRHVYPCIRCAYCVAACPIFLDPSTLETLARNEEHARMADELNLMDCFECGSCSFVCPSHIPLVHQFRMAKAAVRKARST
jgi:electron transport complex protein RnfC